MPVAKYKNPDTGLWERVPAGYTPSGGLDATGVTEGYVPTADGADGYAWAAQAGGSGSGATVETAQVSESTLAGTPVTGVVTMASLCRVLLVSSDVACRLRLYASTTARDADVSRSTATEPSANAGIFLDATVAAGETLIVSPATTCYVSGSNDVPYTLENGEASSTLTTVTLTYASEVSV